MKVQCIKLLVLLALLGGFYAFNGFERPTVAQEDYRSPRRMARAWIITVIMFLVVAVMTLWGNAIAQNIDLDIPDGLYPLFGVLLLTAGFVWMLIIRDAVQV